MYYNYSNTCEFHPNDMYKFDQTILNFEPFVQIKAIHIIEFKFNTSIIVIHSTQMSLTCLPLLFLF